MNRQMELGRLDLNLLVPLNALLQERSVTRAAGRLGLSQPALSASLRRLRRHFADELLIRRGNSYVLSALAVQLRHQLPEALRAVEQLFAEHPSFDPSTSEREYHLLGSDYAIAMIGRSLGNAISEAAPRARLRFTRWNLLEALITGRSTLEEADGLIIPHGILSDMPHIDLFTDAWTGLVAADNRAVGEKLTVQQARSLAWVVPFREAGLRNIAEQALRMQGVELNTSLIVDSFLALPDLVANSPRAALIASRLAERACALGDVRTVELPYQPTPLIEAFWWHPARTRDPEHTWLRTLIQEAAATLPDIEVAQMNET